MERKHLRLSGKFLFILANRDKTEPFKLSNILKNRETRLWWKSLKNSDHKYWNKIAHSVRKMPLYKAFLCFEKLLRSEKLQKTPYISSNAKTFILSERDTILQRILEDVFEDNISPPSEVPNGDVPNAPTGEEIPTQMEKGVPQSSDTTSANSVSFANSFNSLDQDIVDTVQWEAIERYLE